MEMQKNPKTISEIQSRFHEIYHKEIAPIMIDLEKKRKVELLKFILALTILIAGVLMSIYPCLNLNCSFILFFIGLAVTVVSGYLLYYINNRFSTNLKQKCMPKIAKAFGEMSWYQESEILSNSKIKKSELFANYNQRDDDDAFLGSYKDVDFSVTETYLWYMSGSGRNKIIYSIFRGVIVNFASNKNIKNKTIIATKGDFNIKGRDWAFFIALLMICPYAIIKVLYGEPFTTEDIIMISFTAILIICISIFYLKSNHTKNKEKLNEIKLEDPEFNKRYKAYSSDEVEGRYLITTAFMERFKNLQTAFGAKNAKCSFYGDYIMFAISTRKNLFEIGNLFTPLTDLKHMKIFFNELSSILALIDYFKLDEKIGL